MNKIIVIGCCGSGKSYFSKSLSSKLEIPLYHMDMLFWNSNKEHITQEKLNNKIRNIICNDKWIIDGNYYSSIDLRINECDTIFFLDFSLQQCLEAIKERTNITRSDIPFIETDNDTADMIEYVNNIYDTEIADLRNKLLKCTDKNVVVFKNRIVMNEYLNSL